MHKKSWPRQGQGQASRARSSKYSRPSWPTCTSPSTGNTNRTALPELPPAVGTVQVDGRIAPPPAKLYAFESREQGKIGQNLDLAGFAQETGLPLAAYSILQSGPQGDGLLRDWAAIQTGVAKHHGYAFQWFALSGLITVLFIWFQIVRRFFIIR